MLKTEAGAIAAKRKRGVFPARKNDRIRDEIARRISVGLYTGQMPSVAELAKEFDVNPMTICKALDSLEKSGAIKKSERVGTFVKHKRRIAVLFASKANKEMGSRLHRNLAYMPLIDGIEAAAESKDYTAISYSCDPRDKEFVSALRNKVDGCVLITPRVLRLWILLLVWTVSMGARDGSPARRAVRTPDLIRQFGYRAWRGRLSEAEGVPRFPVFRPCAH